MFILNQNVSISLSGKNDYIGIISRVSKGVELTMDGEFNQSSFSMVGGLLNTDLVTQQANLMMFNLFTVPAT